MERETKLEGRGEADGKRPSFQEQEQRNAKEPLRGALLCHLVQVASFIKKGTRLYVTDHSPYSGYHIPL